MWSVNSTDGHAGLVVESSIVCTVEGTVLVLRFIVQIDSFFFVAQAAVVPNDSKHCFYAAARLQERSARIGDDLRDRRENAARRVRSR